MKTDPKGGSALTDAHKALIALLAECAVEDFLAELGDRGEPNEKEARTNAS